VISIEHLKVIQAILEQGGFRAASEHLNKAQSAVSYAVRQVELYYDVELFHRDRYKPTLTPKGKLFFERASRLLAQAGEFDRFARELVDNDEVQLKIGVSALMPLEPIAAILREVRAEFPETSLHLNIEVLSGERLLDQEDLDISILESFHNPSRFVIQDLVTIPMPICVAVDHPLTREKEVTVTHLLGFPQVILKSTLPSEDHVGVLNDTLKWYVTDLGAKKLFIQKGLGWGRLPLHTVQEELEQELIAQLEELEPITAHMYLARLKDKPHGPAGRAFWQKVANYFTTD